MTMRFSKSGVKVERFSLFFPSDSRSRELFLCCLDRSRDVRIRQHPKPKEPSDLISWQKEEKEKRCRRIRESRHKVPGRGFGPYVLRDRYLLFKKQGRPVP